MSFTKRQITFRFLTAGLFFLLFALLTLEVKLFDLAPIGPQGSTVGFSSLNGAFRDLIGTNDVCHLISTLCGGVALLSVPLFGILGLVQWIKRKKLLCVDPDLFVLVAIYALTIVFYLLFEIVVVNYRPVLEDGVLAASYPSSHTLLSIVLFGTAFLQCRGRVRKPALRVILQAGIMVLLVSTVICRLLSGVHWFTDILGGILLGAAILALYHALMSIVPFLFQKKASE